jgi:hypothetical protein
MDVRYEFSSHSVTPPPFLSLIDRLRCRERSESLSGSSLCRGWALSTEARSSKPQALTCSRNEHKVSSLLGAPAIAANSFLAPRRILPGAQSAKQLSTKGIP